jgi:hypothetical protein
MYFKTIINVLMGKGEEWVIYIRHGTRDLSVPLINEVSNAVW